MKRFALAVAAALAVSIAIVTATAAAAGLLTVARARHAIETKAKQACAGKCEAFGAQRVRRISKNKVSGVAFVRLAGETCTDRVVVTRTSTGGLDVTAAAYPAGWTCR